MRIAAIDIGTNTTLLLVAEADRGALRAVREEATITRLGEGVDVARKLAPAAIARTIACLERYASIVRELGASRVAVVGTSALRDAGGDGTGGGGGAEVLAKVRELFGVEARTISGEEEARLTFGGALSGLDVGEGPVAVFDIGGGSTEIVVGVGGAIRASHSFDVGSVRLTERFVRTDPPSRAELEAMTRAAREAFASEPRVVEAARGVGTPVGIAGTVTTLAAVALDLVPYDGARVHGYTMTADAMRAVVDRLAALPLAARREVRGLEPKRADVIVAGGLIALAVLEAMGARSMRVSDRGVRWGLAQQLAARP
jgi:exopolyphosphatase/guanosine-5'-triphosphate,3'-diphosphate pyrophosphatase